MPVRRAAARTSSQETAPKTTPEGEEVVPPSAEPTASSEESASTREEQEVPPAAPAQEEKGEGKADNVKAAETEEKGDEKQAENGGEGEKGEKEKDTGKEKGKKVKKTIPAWATMSFSKRTTTVSLYNQPKVDDIVIEAIQACKDKSGASTYAIRNYIVKKYASLELDKKKFLIRKALKRLVEKGVVKQLKGKGFSGSFTVGRQSPKSGNQTLGDTLPLIITRLCEPKEASYVLIKKYLEQHFPQFNIEQRPDLLKSALQRAVDKGHLEQITGKGASGTFQLKKASDQPLLQGGELEEAILTAITAMNEPKTCSITTLRKFLLETHKDSKVYKLVGNLRRTLQRCKKMGWMEQITGNGLNGSYQLSYPYYPSPAVLFPDKNKEKEKSKRRRQEDSESDERDSEEEDSEEDEGPPPKKRKQQKRSPPKLPRPPRAKKSWQASRVKAKGKRPTPAKRPPASPKKPAARPKKPVAPAKKPAAKAASASKATPPTKSAPPAKRAPPTKSTAKEKADHRSSKPKTLVAKKLTSKAPARPASKKAPSKKSTPKSAVQAKSAQRKSLRSKK